MGLKYTINKIAFYIQILLLPYQMGLLLKLYFIYYNSYWKTKQFLHVFH